MKINDFLHITLNPYPTGMEILKKILKLDSIDNTYSLGTTITPYEINSLNTYIPYLLKEKTDTMEISVLIFNGLKTKFK
jgi:hypothetical protein